ncbi:MAG: hypothetical protein EXS43_12000 [Opitutus sp.]|nr:hypothetical protein [Opitutus sp.]
MIRRLFVFALMLASAVAPAMPIAQMQENLACCAGDCGAPCRPECALPPISSARTTGADVATVERRATAAKPAARSTPRPTHQTFLAGFLFAPSARGFSPERTVPAASVALFQAHCSLRL